MTRLGGPCGAKLIELKLIKLNKNELNYYLALVFI
jgi:hypothetical protein